MDQELPVRLLENSLHSSLGGTLTRATPRVCSRGHRQSQFVAIRQCQAEALPGLRLSLSTGVPATVGTQPFVLPRAALGSANAYVGLGRVTQGSG